MLASRSSSILAGYSARSTGKGYSAEYLARSTGEVLWDTQWATQRDPLAGYSTWRGRLVSYSGTPSRILGGFRCQAALAGYLAGCTGGGILGGIHWRAALAGRDQLASCSGRILAGIHWRAALAGYSAGSTGEPLARYSAGSTGEPLWRDTGRDPRRAALAGYLAGSTGEQLWRDTWRDH